MNDPHELTTEELEKLPVEKGIIKIMVLDGRTNRGIVVECPSHGDVIAHIHNNQFDKLKINSEYKINK